MAIRIVNRLITPYSDKDDLKVIWGDTQTFEFTLPSPHQAGDAYHLGIDQDRVVYPPSRPLCAYTKAFEVDGGTLTMTLTYNTGRLRDYVCKLRKPTPIYIQLDRVRGGKCETLLLDTLLALPSVLDSQNTVVEGDPLAELLEAKLDKPYAEGNPGEILSLDDDGQPVWRPEQEIPEQEQADWDESDSSAVTYIRNKPAISKVGHTGEYNDILNRPDLKPVATSGSYEDLTDKPHIPVDPVQADYEQSDSTALDYIKHKPDLSVYSLITETGNSIAMSIDDDYDLVVSLLDKNGNTLSTQDIDLPIESMIVDATYAAGVLTLTLQNGNTVDVDISDIVSGLVPDSRTVNGHALDADVTVTASDLGLATVATTGSYNDLTDKPVIPVQEQADWDQSDSTAVDFIKGKPVIPAAQVQSDWDQSDSTAVDYIKDKPVLAAVATTGSYWSLTNRPAVPYNTGDYFTIRNNTSNSAGSTVKLEKVGSPRDNTFQYCTNGSTDAWSDYTLGSTITIPQYGYVKFRNKDYGKLLGNGSASNYYHFVITGNVWLSGNLVSMKDRTMSAHAYAGGADLYAMFKDNAAITDASGLIIPINDVNVNTYASMFENCTGMVYGPAELPAMKFSGTNCYMNMFKGCTSLKVAPRLPAVTLTNNCYYSMFSGCTSLIEPPPELPAPVLLQQSYYQMFKGCTALKKSPDIKATTIANSSMFEMFSGCSALNEVKIAFSNFAPTGVTTPVYNWMASTGTGVFRCPAALSISTRGASTVPSGWMVDRIDDPRSNWDESDSTESAYVMNKPVIPAGGGSDDADYLCFTRTTVAPGYSIEIRLDKTGSPSDISIEYSTDKTNWTTYTWSNGTGASIILSNAGDKVWWRGENTGLSESASNYYSFVINQYPTTIYTFFGAINISGNMTYLLSNNPSMADSLPAYCFYGLFQKGSSSAGINENTAYCICNELNGYAFKNMYYDQSQMVSAGEFSFNNIILRSDCVFENMYRNCASLIDPPVFPKTITASGQSSWDHPIYDWFKNMFMSCRSLRRGLDTTIVMDFYENARVKFTGMYWGCENMMSAGIYLDLSYGRSDMFTDMFTNCNKLRDLYYFRPAQYDSAWPVVPSQYTVVHVPNGYAPYVQTKYPKNLVEAGNKTQYFGQGSSSATSANIVQDDQTVITYSVSSTLQLNIQSVSQNVVSYSELVIDLQAGATVTAGSNLTLVDTPTAGKRNVCVVRWQGSTARLYVVDTMDLPA